MNVLTSILSISFTLLLYLGVMSLALRLIANKFQTLELLGLYFLVPFISWVMYTLMDKANRRIHPDLYLKKGHLDNSKTDFSLIQALVSSLRSAFQCLFIPTISLGFSFLFLFPLVYIAQSPEHSIPQILIFVLIEILIFCLLGWFIQWRYNKNVLKLMMEKSSKGPAKVSTQKAGSSSKKLKLNILDASKDIKLSKRGKEKQQSANRLKRLAWLRDVSGPIAAFIGIAAVAYAFNLKELYGYPIYIPLAVFCIISLLIGRTGSSFRLGDRTPFRQFRLGFGFYLHTLLLALLSPLVLLTEISGRGGQPEKQWKIIPGIGRWISEALRSPRLFWIPVILLAAVLLYLEWSSQELEEKDFILLIATICFLAGIVSYEISYRLFNRFTNSKNANSNRMVFLRVFGDQRRGQFLFSHLAPRWKGFGSITCIAAPDVSVHQLEADIGFDILLGRLRYRFLNRDEAGVIGRHIHSNAIGAVWEDHCFDDTWMSAVESMFTQHAIVMMDLRGFTPQRKGCIYELGVLRDKIHMDSVVFLVDDSTDLEFLKTTFVQLWKSVAKDSPNQSKAISKTADQSAITIFQMGESKEKSATQLTKLLINACVSNETYHQAHGQIFLQELIDDLQLLSAEAAVQIKTVGAGRLPGKKILEAGWSSDHDLGHSSFLNSWKIITDQQTDAISEVNEAIQFIRYDKEKLTEAAVKDNPDWEDLRIASRKSLKALGKRRNTPKPPRKS